MASAKAPFFSLSMISDELLNRIKEVDDNRIQIAAKTPEGIALLRSVYSAVFKEKYAENCGPCHEQAFYKLIKILNNPQKFISMSEKKYLLKDGHQVSIFGSPQIYTNENLTDAKAKSLLHERPALAKSFSLINGKPAAEFEAKQEEAPLVNAKDLIKTIKSAKTVEEVKGLLGSDSRTSVIAAADAKIKELGGEPEAKTKKLTQEDFDNDPELEAQGFKVGDLVKETEE